MTRGRVVFAVCIVAVAAGALAVRLPRLAQRPMHGDEANQAVKAGVLLETGVYRYDPDEHHGPTLYWLTLPSLWLSGASTFADSDETAYRIVPVVFGAAIILLLPLVADGLSRSATIFAALLTAISPAMFFYSRYYIQETLLVFFTLAAIGCGWRYVRRPSWGWAVGTGAMFGLMHATKETWIMSAAAMVAATGATVFWTRGREGRPHTSCAQPPRIRSVRAALGHAALAILAAIVMAAALFSSFGTNWRGPLDSLLCYDVYFQRGGGGGAGGLHAHPWHYYLELLFAYRPAQRCFWTEGFIGGLAVIAVGASLTRRALPEPRRQLVRWLGFYTAALVGIYSLITYKTPWCMLSFLHGMILLAGVGGWTLLRNVPTWFGKGAVALALAVGLIHLGWQSYSLNFRFFADQRNPHVYAHTSSDVLNFARQMDRMAAVSPAGHQMVIHVVTPENPWPLPWYLRRFNTDHVGFWRNANEWQDETAGQPPPSVIALTDDMQAAVEAVYPTGYNRQMITGLRPGVLLSVWVRDDLWQAFVASMSTAD